jgi:hypothetical protein
MRNGETFEIAGIAAGERFHGHAHERRVRARLDDDFSAG